MSRQKKSKAVPVVIFLTILIAALAVLCFLIKPLVIEPQKAAIAKANADAKAAVEERNKKAEAEYKALIAEMESEYNKPTNPDWPEHSPDKEWEILDLSNIPLESQTAETRTRAQLMEEGNEMLLVNAWHSRPLDFNESKVTSVNKRKIGDLKIQAKDSNVTLFPKAIDALGAALIDANAAGYTHYMVDGGYRTYQTQEKYFNEKMEKLSSKYSGEALVEAAKKEVNYPGTSEYNSGLGFDLRLYDRNDPDVGAPKYSTTPEGKWMTENCWKYGIIFRFPQNAWPLETSTDKSFKTGVSVRLNLYRYVGKGNAAIMHYMDFTMEEYIEYLEEHPHIAVYEDNVLKYEIYRQYVGETNPINLQLTGNARSYTASLDNMGAVITVFGY
jgi:D-alanyl-D-alanine carboxypeptidase